MVFQSYAIWPHMTVAENVGYPLTIQRRPRAEIRSRGGRCAQDRGSGGTRGTAGPPSCPAVSSSGVAFARALINEPKVMLLDEPLSNLDAKLREQMRFEIKALQRRVNITTIYVTHDQAEALAISDQIAVMPRRQAHRGRGPAPTLRQAQAQVHRHVSGSDQPHQRKGLRSRGQFSPQPAGYRVRHALVRSRGAHGEGRPCSDLDTSREHHRGVRGADGNGGTCCRGRSTTPCSWATRIIARSVSGSN